MRIKLLSVEDVQFIAHTYAKTFLSYDEPIPDFETRYPGVLERCLGAPRQTFDGQLYKGLVKKAAIVFYLMIKNHPFQNGNKRLALISLLVLLIRNSKWLSVSNDDVYEFAKFVAASPAKSKSLAVQAIEAFLKKHVS